MPWLTSNVFKQGPEEPLVRLPQFDDGPTAARFRHIIHAYRDQQLPQNTAVQAITFESVRLAAHYAAPKHSVSCVAVTYEEDGDLVPPGVVKTPPLTRVVGDVAQFQVPRPLPLLFDVLRLGADAKTTPQYSSRSVGRLLKQLSFRRGAYSDHTDSHAQEYIVLTNSDIHLQPIFYQVIGTMIEKGYDVITSNRRTLDVDAKDRAFSPLFLADHGRSHPGFDCFVFPRSMMDNFVPSLSCCGAGHVMRSLLFNLVAHAKRFMMLTEAHLTYHLGDDMAWNAAPLVDYIEFNTAEARSVLVSLSSDPAKEKRLTEFIAAHEDGAYAPPWKAERNR